MSARWCLLYSVFLCDPLKAVPEPGLDNEDDWLLDRSGQVLSGRWKVERLLGVGAMGSIWLVRQTALNSEAVVKFHEADFSGAGDPASRQRFIRECKALASVRHQNVVELYEVGETESDELYLLMERLRGASLDRRLAAGYRPAVPEAVSVVSGVLAGLEAVHGAGVLHRDVKPENIFLVDDELEGHVPKLLDFGLARGLGWSSNRLTRTGTTVGTPGYMSPEQARGMADLDERTDVYSTGVVLYEMLTGCLPFEAETAGDLMIKACTEDPIPVDRHRSDLHPSLSLVVMTAIASVREDRYSDAKSMRLELEGTMRALGSGAPETIPAPPPDEFLRND